ncbi:MAG: 2-oxoisovalerate dehydrogenase E2 component (dihydrolipoyl transacylase), partial [Bacteroidia bacterium]
MKIFILPDLGEGLPDAEIVEWLVKEGDEVKLDEPMVSMETAKAVVEVPSPFTGKVVKFFGQEGDVIETGKPLAGFVVEGEQDDEEPVQESLSQSNDEPTASNAEQAESNQSKVTSEVTTEDAGTVVGAMESSNTVVSETTSNVGGIKVTPAVRAMARKLNVDLSRVSPTGKGGVVTRSDVETAAQNPQAATSSNIPAPRTPVAATPVAAPSGEWEAIRGTRRTMARVMSEAHSKVVATTLMDDADIHQWQYGQNITVRLLRCLWAGAMVEPGLNAWYDGEQSMRMIHKGMDVGMAVDTPDGLFVAALRNVHSSTAQSVRSSIDRLKENVVNRSIPPQDMTNYTIMLSNFGIFAGRYATPIINPPCVCIVAA